MNLLLNFLRFSASIILYLIKIAIAKQEKTKMKITNDVIYVGVTDRVTDLFESQYLIPNGISYNSYVINDKKRAIMDSVDIRFAEEWLANIDRVLDGDAPDYLIVQHMEPDHSASIIEFANKYPEAQIVSSAKAFTMMNSFFGCDFSDRRLVVAEGSTLLLGTHELTFITAPMVHWPEVIMTYDKRDKVLYSADAFGKFGAPDIDDGWVDEARRYYIGIVGKYGVQVQSVLKKAAALDIAAICPLHGPVLSDNLGFYISLYDKWSSYTPEEDGVTIAYSSIYGNTRAAAELLADTLRGAGCAVAIYDLSRCDKAEAIASAFRYSKLVLASSTYNADVFPSMRAYISGLVERGFQNRTVAFIENGSWAPMAAKVMRASLESAKNITYAENSVKILSALNAESRAALSALADELK